MNLGKAFKAFFSVLTDNKKAEQWDAICQDQPVLEESAQEEKEEAAPVPAPETSSDAVYTLVLLQREGRLVDFLMEDISAYNDAQVGAAVRQVHSSCAEVLKETFGVSSVTVNGEGSPLEIPEGFDPSEYRLTGSPAGNPPFNGKVVHPGWKVTKTDFAQRAKDLKSDIISPAEIEI